jgi:hypothetical protein
MSLKALHVIFVAVATVLTAVFGWWAWNQFQAGLGSGYLVSAVVSVLAGVSLVVYGRWFLKKLKDVSFL